jgi:6,7-dimethyl-8-ribityllumazine synthase
MHREHREIVEPKDASGKRFGIAVATFNADLTEPMLEAARATLTAWNVREEDIEVVHVPGSFELPFAVQTLLRRSPAPDAVIAIGCIIKGETDHDKYLAATVTDALMRLSLDFKIPVASGITTANTLAQAKARAEGELNRGKEAALAALETSLIS